IGPARIVDPRKTVTTDYWDYGEPFDVYPIDTGRLRRVVELVAEKAEWGRKLPKGHGLGIAAHRSFVSYVASVVEVAAGGQGELVGASRRSRHRLRLCGASRAHPLAARGCRRHGPHRREI